MDERWKRLGDILVEHSVHVQSGEKVMIAMMEIETYDLMRCVYDAVIRAGGYPQVQFLSEELRRSVLMHGNDDQISWVPEMEAWGMEWADAYIALRGAHNPFVLQDVGAGKLSMQQEAMGKISANRWKHTRWVLVKVPTPALAQQAGCDFETLERMFFTSCFLDWPKETTVWKRWSDQLNEGKRIRIVGEGTDIGMSVEGRKWIPFGGANNMPDGEIATSPLCDTVTGTIRFEHPGVLSGRLVRGIVLTWEKGKLIRATSDTEQDFFRSVLRTDAGSSSIGELAIGTNPGVTMFCNDILLDEKIFGTMHIALGRAYPESGGTNKSAIHWDLVKDMRLPGSVCYLDGVPILQEGKILL